MAKRNYQSEIDALRFGPGGYIGNRTEIMELENLWRLSGNADFGGTDPVSPRKVQPPRHPRRYVTACRKRGPINRKALLCR